MLSFLLVSNAIYKKYSFISFYFITWIFVFSGVRRLSKDIEMMLGKQPSKIWKFFWLFVTPPLLTVSIHMTVIYLYGFVLPSIKQRQFIKFVVWQILYDIWVALLFKRLMTSTRGTITCYLPRWRVWIGHYVVIVYVKPYIFITNM